MFLFQWTHFIFYNYLSLCTSISFELNSKFTSPNTTFGILVLLMCLGKSINIHEVCDSISCGVMFEYKNVLASLVLKVWLLAHRDSSFINRHVSYWWTSSWLEGPNGEEAGTGTTLERNIFSLPPVSSLPPSLQEVGEFTLPCIPALPHFDTSLQQSAEWACAEVCEAEPHTLSLSSLFSLGMLEKRGEQVLVTWRTQCLLC